MQTVKGECLCKSVTLSFEIENKIFDACHCGMCRKWSGGPGIGVNAGKSVSFTGKEFITTFQSSEWAERAFCKKCGSHLYYLLKGDQGFYSISLGLLDNAEDFKFHLQIFVDRKPEYYNFAEKTELMTEAQVFEMFAKK